MTKLLNLDEIDPPVQKTVKLKGKVHEMATITVADMIAETRRQEDLQKNYGDGVVPAAVIVDLMIEMVMKSFPTMTKEDVSGLTPEQLKALRDFIVARMEPEEEDKPAGN